MNPEKLNTKNVLPEDFDGVFRFTNWTKADFTAKWDGVSYTYPAEKSSPMLIPNATPEQIQFIRKKFAKELAIEQFYTTKKFKQMDNVPAGGTPALYTDSDLAEFTQKCLEPLPIASAKTKVIPKDDISLRTDDEGHPVTQILDKKKSLMGSASGSIE